MSALVDAEARRAIREDLHATLVVEAAAGTGKTTELVQRIVAVVRTGQGSLASLVAVTFTEKAAGEMKLRLRTELDRALSSSELSSEARARLEQALSELETAQIGTIHGVCADLLRAHPVEAAVDPSFDVADELHARRLLTRVFDAWFENILKEGPPEGVKRVLRRRVVETKGDGARAQLYAAFTRLVETRDFDGPYRRDPFDRAAALDAAFAELRELAALAEAHKFQGDALRKALARLGERLRRLPGGRSGSYDHDALEELLIGISRDNDIFSDRKGSGKTFGTLPREEVLARRRSAKENLDACVVRCKADLAACLWRELRPVVSAYEAEKRREGVLDFFDLLMETRRMLAGHRAVRNRLQGAITHLLVDEFQDTDPVQSEILLLLAADDPTESDPDRARVIAGKLFVVGDPKQSIYRFRRADVSLYERIKNRLVAAGARLLHLSTSFRSLPEIQSFVNASFAPLMTGSSERGQSAYVPLSAFRPTRAGQPALVALPAPRPYGKNGKITKKGINESLPDAVAAFLDWLVHHSGYRVLEAGGEVPVSARHVCLLFRRFRAYGEDVTREYVRALEARRIPHVLSGGRSFHSREEVIALRAVLAAIERPDDALAVYATLRGPFVAFHDATLLKVKHELKHLHPLRKLPDAASPEALEVGGVLALLGQLHRRRNRRPIAQTLSTFLSELRAHAGVAIWPTGEQALGNVLRVLDLSRGYERQRGAVSFRGFVDYLDEHAALGETAEAPVIEETSDGVRIMTVHSAKGLEFPVVVLCDPTAPRRQERPSRFIDPARKLWAQALCFAEPVELLEQRELVRDHDEAEEVRLAYVAATRARDMLVVPAVGDGSFEGWVDALGPALHPPREQRQKPLGPGPRCPPFGRDTVVERPIDAASSEADAIVPGEHAPIAGSHRVVWWDPHVLDLARPSAGGLRQAELLRVDEAKEKDDPYIAAQQAFVAERALLIAEASTKSLSSISVTARSHALVEASEPRPWRPFETLDTVVERSGRPSGTRFGSLVHALFQHSSLLPNHDELATLARALGRSLGATPAEVERALADVHKALAHAIFARMRAANERGELYRETPIVIREPDGTLVDGVVDAAFREGDRIVLIDYKTDMSIDDPGKYGHQLTLYAEALEQLFALPVSALLLRV